MFASLARIVMPLQQMRKPQKEKGSCPIFTTA
jgi:hypothetical protein